MLYIKWEVKLNFGLECSFENKTDKQTLRLNL